MSAWLAHAAGPLRGTVTVPGDKSISHRAIMLAALADGTSHIDRFLEGADTRATASIFEQLGVRIETPSPSKRIVHGVGVDSLRTPVEPLDCGNAGTGMRLLAGLLAGQRFDSVLIGDESLSRRLGLDPEPTDKPIGITWGTPRSGGWRLPSALERNRVDVIPLYRVRVRGVMTKS